MDRPISRGVGITLTPDAYKAAWDAGLERHRHHCLRKNVAVREAGLKLEGMGAVGEAAVAEFLGGAWNAEVGRRHYGSDDVTVTGCYRRIEIKTTDHVGGRLLVYRDTPLDALVVMAILIPADHTVFLAGWLEGKDGRRPEWWEAKFKTPCWAVPQRELRPMEDFPCKPSLVS